MKTILLLAATTLFAALVFPAGSGYRLLKEVPIAGEGMWDYIGADPVNRHIFVSHGTEVEVLDADTGEVVGKIPAPGIDLSNPKSLASQGIRGGLPAPELGRGFTSNGSDGSMSIFDLKTLKVLAVVKTNEGADAFVYDPATRHGFTFSQRSNTAAAVDIAEAKLVGTVVLAGKPDGPVADGEGNVYAVLLDKDMITKFDSRKLVVEQNWPTAPCEEPSSMAIDPKNQRLFVGCRGTVPLLVVMNSENGKVISALPIGGGTDSAAFDPETNLIFSSNGADGTITVIHQESPDKYTVLENIKTEPNARTMALDPKTHKLFLSVAHRYVPPPPGPGQPAGTRIQIPGSFRVYVFGRE